MLQTRLVSPIGQAGKGGFIMLESNYRLLALVVFLVFAAWIFRRFGSRPPGLASPSDASLPNQANYKPTSPTSPTSTPRNDATLPTDHLPVSGNEASSLILHDCSHISIPGYQGLTFIKAGGQGATYRAKQERLDRDVCIKVLLSGNFSGLREREMFLREARAMARVSHSNIVQIFDVGQENGVPYLVMEFVEGGSLDDRLKSGPLSPREAALLAEQVAGALQAIHDQGLVHRDTKPANIMLTRDKVAKLTDFGLIWHPLGNGTRTGTVKGTPDFMPPEQAEGRIHEIDARTDVYSLGATLFAALTASPPFSGQSFVSILDQVRFVQPAFPHGLADTIPEDLKHICLKCMAKQPSDRYPSAQALRDDLNRYLDGQRVQKKPKRKRLPLIDALLRLLNF